MSKNPNKFKIFKTKEFKLFLTVWVVYVFYLQMFGSGCMANSQSALTAAIANEGRFEIDTYHKVSCDISYYKGHYYSGQPPGISFISVPLYILSKPIFYILPQETIDFAFSRLESYGDTLPVDYWGKKKILSSYFTGLSKRQILEHVFISGFILPVFTTSLISALSVLLVYLFLKRFTGNEKLRIIITLFYAFGTLLFPLSTQFLERPIAIALMFAAFFILFRIKHKELKPKGSTLFWSGMLAGLSAWFDYFHIFLTGFLFLYLLSFYVGNRTKIKGTKKIWILNLNRARVLLLLKFVIGALIPILIPFSYYYIIFDDPLANSYTHRVISTSDHKISDIVSIKLPNMIDMYHILLFFINTPIMLIAFYGVYRALLKKDEYHHEAIYISAIIIFISVYALSLALTFPTVTQQTQRHLTPSIPYSMLLLPYALPRKWGKMTTIFIIVGMISVFSAWSLAQFNFLHFDPESRQLILIPYFLQNGPESEFLNALSGIFNMNSLLLNLLGLAVLSLIIFLIWKPYLIKNYYNQRNKYPH